MNAYLLPKRLLRIAVAMLAAEPNPAIRSAANCLLHLVGRYHAAPGTFGRHFFLCRMKLAGHPCMDGHSEWHIRCATKLLLRLGLIRKLWSASKARRRGEGIRKAPTLFGINPRYACFFPAAHSPRAARLNPSPVCGRILRDSQQELKLDAGVHTGEIKIGPRPMGEDPTIFDLRMAEILAAVVSRHVPSR